MIRLDAKDYRRQPWRNGMGVSHQIAEARDGEGWAGLVWSFSRTGFSGPVPFSDQPGIDRIITLVSGTSLVLGARDAGPDLNVPPRSGPVAFDGGRQLDGIAEGSIEVVNLMARRGAVRIAMAYAGAEAQSFGADTVLVHACAGEARLELDQPRGGAILLADRATLRFDGEPVVLRVRAGTLLVATIDRTGTA